MNPLRRRAARTRAAASAVVHAVATALATLAAAPAFAEQTVALVGPMSGRYAIYGAQMRAGADLAVEDINAAGGIGGETLRLAVEDDGCERAGAIAAAEMLARLQPALVTGHFCSSATLAAAPAYARAGAVQITPASTAAILTEQRPAATFFRLAGREDRQGETAGRHLAEAFRGGRIVLLHDRTAYGIALAEGARRALEAAGIAAAAYEGFVAGEKDYSALAARLKTIGADAALVGGFPTEVALILKAVRAAGLATVVLAGDAIATPEFVREAGALAEATLMTFQPDHTRGAPAADVVRRLRERRIEPESLMLATYAAFQVWAGAARAAGTFEAGKVAAALAAGPHASVLGPVSFDRKGDADIASYAIHVWAGGRYRQMP